MSPSYSLAPRIMPPPTITQVQSYSFVIRNMLFDRLAALPFFAAFSKRKTDALQIQPEQLPLLGVYFLGEEMGPDGDFNIGDIRFLHTLKVGFSVIVVNNDPVECEATLDQAFWTIMNTLWRDPSLTNMVDTRAYPGGVGNPDNTRIEGVTKGYRQHVFGHAGQNNETPIGEMRYEASVRYGADYPPIINDNLLTISTRTGIKPGDTPEEMAARAQVGADYHFDPYPPPAPQPLKK
jgi:hypothetical protein